MELDELFGLPAHPLVVHAAVVLLPLAALATVLVALVPRLRRHYAPVALGLAIVATGFVGLAQGSGEQLEDRVDETELVEAHTEKGETVLPWAIGVSVIAAGVTLAEPLARRFPDARLRSRAVDVGLGVVALVATVGATIVVIDVGHSGAKATWDELPARAAGHDDDD